MSGPDWSVASAAAAAAAAVVLGRGGARSRLARLRLVVGREAGGGRLPSLMASTAAWRSLAQRTRDKDAVMHARLSVPSALALELRSGHPLADALEAVATEHRHLAVVSSRLSAAATAVETGIDPAVALLGGGRVAGPRGLVPALSRLRPRGAAGARPPDDAAATRVLRPTAACVSVGHQAGLPLADLLESVAAAATSSVEVHELAQAELAGARASTWLLAALPLAGLMLGQLIGGHPARFLLETTSGRLCLVVATALTAAGWLWTRALTRNLERELVP